MKSTATVNLVEERISNVIEKDSRITGSIDIFYPQVKYDDMVVEQYVNGVHHSLANSFYKTAKAVVNPRCQKKSKDNKNKELIIAEAKYHSTLNSGGLISGYSDNSISTFKDGVLSTRRVAVSFDMVKAKHIWLSSNFKSLSGYKKRLIKAILHNIEQNKQAKKYKDNIAELVELNLYNGNFYLTEKDIIIFYQPGEICDDKSFIPSFSISKQSLHDILK